MKKILLVFLFVFNSFLYGIDIDLSYSLVNIDFREDSNSTKPVYSGEMDAKSVYGIRVANEFIWDIKFERNNDYYTSLAIDAPLFYYSSFKFMQKVVLGLEYNNYKLRDGTNPLDFKQKSIFIAYQTDNKKGRVLIGLIYKKDDEKINKNGNIIVNEEDNVGLIVKISNNDLFRNIFKDYETIDNGFGYLIDNLDFQYTNESKRVAIELGVGYKYDGSLLYSKIGYSSEEKRITSLSSDRSIYKLMFGFRQTF